MWPKFIFQITVVAAHHVENYLVSRRFALRTVFLSLSPLAPVYLLRKLNNAVNRQLPPSPSRGSFPKGFGGRPTCFGHCSPARAMTGNRLNCRSTVWTPSGPGAVVVAHAFHYGLYRIFFFFFPQKPRLNQCRSECF